MFAPSNDLTPTPAPPCLSDLTQVEKSAISIICLSIAIHKKGTGSASKGHTIAFFQDVETFASILPRVPDELLFIVLKESDKARAITKQEDYRLRMKALNDNPDKVDSYFSERLQVLLKHVMPILGALYWIIRFEVQAHGTIHAHLLIGVKGGPSKHDLEKARTKNDAYQKCTDDEKREIDECRDNVLTCSCANLGISTMHPRPDPDPANWPGPYGQDMHTPAVNILQQRFLDVSHNPDELQERYEKLVNRVMLHHCRDGYCLEKNSNGEKVCRFKFPMKLIGFEAVVSDDGKTLLRPRRLSDVAADGAIYVDGKLCYFRNHPTIVHHIPELLTIWGANIEGRTIETYEQVLRYLLKYMYKAEPDSQTFQAISKAVVSNSDRF
ncbi:hypothetical protein ACOMHN_034760 [Nucella lapillus]